jgi:hypothetical protein
MRRVAKRPDPFDPRRRIFSVAEPRQSGRPSGRQPFVFFSNPPVGCFCLSAGEDIRSSL